MTLRAAVIKAFDTNKHPRKPNGPGGGEFSPKGKASPQSNSVSGLGRQMHSFLYNKVDFALLDHPDFQSGWLDGGCRVLGEALHDWLGTGQIKTIVSPKGVQHVVYKVGNWFIDGDGISSETTLLRRWKEVENVPDAKLSDATNFGNIPTNDDIKAKLVASLSNKFDKNSFLAALGNKSSPLTTKSTVDEATTDDSKMWTTSARELKDIVGDGYLGFLENLLLDVDPDNDSNIQVMALRENGKPQAMLGYEFTQANPDRYEDDLADGLGKGLYLNVQTLAVAPWNHRNAPGRQGGFGTKMFMAAVRKMLANPKAKGLALESKDAEADKFYDALGLESHTKSGRTRTHYTLDRARAKEIYDVYQKRGAGLRPGGEKRGLDIRAEAQARLAPELAAAS